MQIVSEERGGSERAALAVSLIAGLLFGSQFVAIKLGMDGLDPLFFGAVTTGIGGLIALSYTLWRGLSPFRAFLRWEVWATAMFSSAQVSLQYIGLTMVPASIGGLIVGSNIMFVAPISALVFKERLGTGRALGVAIGLIGVFTVSTGWDLSIIGSGHMLGYLAMIGASLSIAMLYPMNRLVTRRMRFEEWVAAFHLLIPVFLLPMVLMGGGIETASAASVPAMLFVGILCTSVPTLLWSRGLQSLTFVTSATVMLSESVFAVVLGLLIIGEPMTSLTFIGAAMVFIAIFLTSYKKRGVEWGMNKA